MDWKKLTAESELPKDEKDFLVCRYDNGWEVYTVCWNGCAFYNENMLFDADYYKDAKRLSKEFSYWCPVTFPERQREQKKEESDLTKSFKVIRKAVSQCTDGSPSYLKKVPEVSLAASIAKRITEMGYSIVHRTQGQD